MINVLYTVCQHPFKTWVDALVEERNAALAEEDHVEMDSQVYQAYQRSTAVSRKSSCGCLYILTFLFLVVSKGTGAHLLKPSSKRRRGKAEIKEAKRAEALRQQGQDQQAQ